MVVSFLFCLAFDVSHMQQKWQRELNNASVAQVRPRTTFTCTDRKNGRKIQSLVAVWSPAFFSIKHMNAGAGIPLASFSANLQVV